MDKLQYYKELRIATVFGFVSGFASQNRHLPNPTQSGIEFAMKYYTNEDAEVFELVEKLFACSEENKTEIKPIKTI